MTDNYQGTNIRITKRRYYYGQESRQQSKRHAESGNRGHSLQAHRSCRLPYWVLSRPDPDIKQCVSVRVPGCLDYAEGSIITPEGTVQVHWDVREKPILEYRVLEGIAARSDTEPLKQRANERKADQI